MSATTPAARRSKRAPLDPNRPADWSYRDIRSLIAQIANAEDLPQLIAMLEVRRRHPLLFDRLGVLLAGQRAA